MLTFWLVTGLDDHRWKLFQLEDGARFHRKEGRVLWLVLLATGYDNWLNSRVKQHPQTLRLHCILCRHPPIMTKDWPRRTGNRRILRRSTLDG